MDDTGAPKGPQQPSITSENDVRAKRHQEQPKQPSKNLGELFSVAEAATRSEQGYEFLIQGDIESFNALRAYPMWRPNFAGKSFRGMNLAGVDLNRAHLAGADFTGANLENADLWLANLQEAQLSRTNLTRANLRLANLNEANFQFTDLSTANLACASLERSWLQGANIRTDLTNVKFFRAIFDENTKLPEPERFLEAELSVIDRQDGVITEFPPTLPREYIARIEKIIADRNSRSSRIRVV